MDERVPLVVSASGILVMIASFASYVVNPSDLGVATFIAGLVLMGAGYLLTVLGNGASGGPEGTGSDGDE
ncbi:MAG: hypothetical protein IJ026_07545 [Candidatus Methanomethylophilaceae archaeon]|nr:hypothetical protein [Candidatus Methanomethylophilaceae archaeon]